MSESSLDELKGLSRRAVELSRRMPVPEADLAAALERIVARSPSVRRRAWREPLRKAIVAAAVVMAVAGLVHRAPAAWVEVATAARLSMQAGAEVAPPLPVEGPPVRKLRGLLLVHIFSVVSGYAAYALVWLLSCAALLVMLFTDAPRLLRNTVRVSVVLLALGVLLMVVGIVLGAVWAEANLGRYWGWDAKEINGLATLLVGVMWLVLSWRHMRTWAQGARGRIEPGALAAACFWTSIGGWWGIAYVGGGFMLWQAGMFICLCVLLNIALLAAVWGRTPILPT